MASYSAVADMADTADDARRRWGPPAGQTKQSGPPTQQRHPSAKGRSAAGRLTDEALKGQSPPRATGRRVWPHERKRRALDVVFRIPVLRRWSRGGTSFFLLVFFLLRPAALLLLSPFPSPSSFAASTHCLLAHWLPVDRLEIGKMRETAPWFYRRRRTRDAPWALRIQHVSNKTGGFERANKRAGRQTKAGGQAGNTQLTLTLRRSGFGHDQEDAVSAVLAPEPRASGCAYRAK
ncbi:hypothetical protein QBC47DRAFT_79235 [Echria macrotheca]|uniref:Uncharacterized protein n=1 Tax=Echria macrotheca TaxID=438768 RepID=A0AAJ0B647_9PEZI|nr:hypothetical protein QBC47DRAFT_79235 [Echria macrotheca]